MPKPTPATDEVQMDAELLQSLGDIACTAGNQLYEVIKQRLAHGRDEAAVTLHMLAVNMILGMMLKHHPNAEQVAPQVNVLWKLLKVPFHMTLDRSQ
jgi:hypothetical protein